jgi:hypothetical protein
MAKRNLPIEIIHHVMKDNPMQDTIEIGTPGKGGVLKVHFRVDDSYEDTCERIDRAVAALEYARAKVNKNV